MQFARLALSSLALAALAVPLAAQFGPQDFALSAPAAGAIWRVDASTNAGAAYVSGFSIPHYGWFGADGNLYVPDRGWVALMQVKPDGTATAISSGGKFLAPVTCIPSVDGAAWVTSDMAKSTIFRVDYDGTQTVMHDQTTTSGLLNWPDGMAFDDAGNLYVANLGSDTVIRIDTAGHASILTDSPLISWPGGLALDGAGNVFVANYKSSTITRTLLATGETTIFAGPETSKVLNPNDLKLSRHGGLLTCGRYGSVVRIDALGQMTVEFQDPNLIELDGVAVPEDSTLCSGRFEQYGAGTAGSGGFVPKFSAIFSPGPGQLIGLELKDFRGGAPAIMFVGSASLPAGALKFKGADLLVDPSSAIFLLLPLGLPGAGAGNGDLTMQFQVPMEPALDGLTLYHQVFAGDNGAAHGVSASNGLKETFGL
jgi:sugar lactone lactonase YvrE